MTITEFDPDFNQRRIEKDTKYRKWCEEHNQNYLPFCENVQELKTKIYEAFERGGFKASIIPTDDCYCHLVSYVIFSEDNETKEEIIWGSFFLPAEKIGHKEREELEKWIDTIFPNKNYQMKEIKNTCCEDDFSMLAHYYND